MHSHCLFSSGCSFFAGSVFRRSIHLFEHALAQAISNGSVSLTSDAISCCHSGFYRRIDCWRSAPLALAVLVSSYRLWILHPSNSCDNITAYRCCSWQPPCMVQSFSHGSCYNSGRNCCLDGTDLPAAWNLGHGKDEENNSIAKG